jgi:serine/threonine protein kinase
MDKKDFGEFTYAPKAIFTWEFSRAPNKKGLCHLKLLDVQEDTFIGARYNKTTDVLTIQGDNFAYTEIIGKGTNIAKLYTNNNGYGVVVKHGNTDTSLELDIVAVDKLKNKKYKSRFINTYVLDRQNILMEPFQGTLISLSADYHYNISLNIVEYIKILNFVATTLAMMSSDNPPLYYSDLKAENILYKCKNKGEYIIKFADTGSITSSPSLIGTYSPPDSDESEKFITWTFGIFIIQLIGGVWINGKYYRRLLKTDKKKLEEYIDDLVSHSKHSIKMFHNLDDSHELFNIIDQTLVRDANNRISISDLANKTETLLNKYLK